MCKRLARLVIFLTVSLPLFTTHADASIASKLLENFDDGENPFPFSYTGQIVSNGQFTGTRSLVESNGGIELQHQCFALSVADAVTGTAVQSSSHLRIPGVPGEDFEVSVDFSVANLSGGGVKDDATQDQSATVAIGALGGQVNNPGTFNGFVNTGSWAYYLAVVSVLKTGDDLDPLAPTVEGAVRLVETGWGSDGQVNAESGKITLPKVGTSTLSLRGTYDQSGILTLNATVTAGGMKSEISDVDTTPLPGEWFGVRTAAWTRSGNNPQTTIDFDVNFDNFAVYVKYQPDALIGKNASSLLGRNVINKSGKSQTKKAKIAASKTANYTLQFHNDGTEADDLSVKGAAGGGGFTAHYFDGNTNITGEVTGGGYILNGLAPGDSKTLKLKVNTDASLSSGESRSIKITAKSQSNSKAADTVKAKVIIR